MLRPESNGGVSCPDLQQTKQCQAECRREEEEDATDSEKAVRLTGHKHKTQQAVRGEQRGALKLKYIKKLPEYFLETAMILPGKYSQLHNDVDTGDSYDVRENLKTFLREENSDEYCVVFRVEKAMKNCKFNEDTTRLIRGAEICVGCESKSIRPHLGDRCAGHGVEDKLTRSGLGFTKYHIFLQKLYRQELAL